MVTPGCQKYHHWHVPKLQPNCCLILQGKENTEKLRMLRDRKQNYIKETAEKLEMFQKDVLDNITLEQYQILTFKFCSSVEKSNMKIIFGVVLHYVLFFNICAFAENKIKETEVKDGLDLKETIEQFLKDLKLKIPEVITLADQNITIPSNKYIEGTVNLSSIACKGIKEFNATVIYRSFLPLPKAYILSLDDIVLSLDYKSNLTIYDSKYFSLFGEGTASMSLTNLIFDGNVTISLLPINASTTADVNLENVLVNVTGLLDDQNFSSDFGKFLSKSISTIFDANRNAISKTLTEILNFILQDILNHHHQLNEDKNHDLQDDLLHYLQDIFSTSFITSLTDK